MFRFVIIMFFLSSFLKIYSQNTIALPEITNYSRQVYLAGTQNWNIKQDEKGIIYCANNEGLLSFDGSHWKKYILPNETIIRSLYIAPGGRVYVGAQGDLGYFSPSTNGELRYTSLIDLIPQDERDFADVWEVIPFDKKIFFRSNKRIFQLDNGHITVFNSISWGFLGSANGILLAKDYQSGLVQYKSGRWTPLSSGKNIPAEAKITSFISLNRDSSLITTLKHGIYILHRSQLNRLSSPVVDMLADKNIYSSAQIEHNLVAIGTNLAGCYIINEKGELVQKLSKQEGLQHNNVLSIFLDNNKNIWLGLDNGIDHIAYNNAIRHIVPDISEPSSGYASAVFNKNLYIGTCQGLFRAPIEGIKNIGFSKSNFTLVKNTSGQVWNLSEVNDQLLMGHNDGFFVVKDNSAGVIDATSGFWNFIPLHNQAPSPIVIAGTYNGVNFYNYKEGRFTNPSVHTHFESARFIGIDNNIAWVAHPYKGLYKVDLAKPGQPSYTVYQDKKGILSRNRNHIFKIRSRIILSTDKGLFEYDAKKDDFIPSTYLRKFFSEPVSYLKEDDAGNIWFVEKKRLGVIDFSGPVPTSRYIPELDNKIMANGFEYVYPYNSRNIFVAGEEGFYVIDYEQLKQFKPETPVMISNVQSLKESDSVYYGGFGTAGIPEETSLSEAPLISYSNNSLHFDFCAPLYGKQQVEYSYYLEGYESNWSTWSGKNEKEYTNLSPGCYVFKVRSRKYKGDEASLATYAFTILPPWYRTNLAYTIYFILVIVLIYGIHLWQQKKFIMQQERHDEEQRRMQYLHQLEIDRNESEIIRLRNEKLEAEILLKEKELASTSMNLVQKDEMLGKVKEEFVRLKKDGVMDNTSDEYKKILRMLEESKGKENWDQFAVHFDKVHSDFLISLRNHFPRLTPSELKLCSFLRLNLSSKEISQIMNITIKSVELSRYRLRKKLNLPSEVNLYNFLLNFSNRSS